MEKLRKLSFKGLCLIGFVAVTAVAVCNLPDPPVSQPWWVMTVSLLLDRFPSVDAWFIALYLFLSGMLRAISELIIFIASKTETKKDDEAAASLVQVLKWIGAITGWFGLGNQK